MRRIIFQFFLTSDSFSWYNLKRATVNDKNCMNQTCNYPIFRKSLCIEYLCSTKTFLLLSREVLKKMILLFNMTRCKMASLQESAKTDALHEETQSAEAIAKRASSSQKVVREYVGGKTTYERVLESQEI